MKEFEKLRREIKADLALTHGLQRDMTKRLESTEVAIRHLADNVTQLQLGAEATTQVSRRIEGSLRKTGERFDKILRVMSEEFAPMTELVSLEARVEARLADIEGRLSA